MKYAVVSLMWILVLFVQTYLIVTLSVPIGAAVLIGLGVGLLMGYATGMILSEW